MENKLFTTVAIEDRHVGEPHVAFTQNGVRYFGKIWLDNTRLKWYCEVDEDVQPYVTHVLEEVKLPTEDEVINVCDNVYGDEYSWSFASWIYNHIINKLR